jgi:hypothetical protein
MALAAQQQRAAVKSLTDANMLVRDQPGSFGAGPGLHNFLNMRKQSSTVKINPPGGGHTSYVFSSTTLPQPKELPGQKPVHGHEDVLADHLQVGRPIHPGTNVSLDFNPARLDPWQQSMQPQHSVAKKLQNTAI